MTARLAALSRSGLGRAERPARRRVPRTFLLTRSLVAGSDGAAHVPLRAAAAAMRRMGEVLHAR